MRSAVFWLVSLVLAAPAPATATAPAPGTGSGSGSGTGTGSGPAQGGSDAPLSLYDPPVFEESKLSASQPSKTATAPAPAQPGSAKPVTLPNLLQAFAQSPGVMAQFTEQKRIALLSAPLTSSGTLYYAQPGMLARHTTAPEPSILIVDPTQVRMFDGKRWEVIGLDAKPVVRLFVESFVRILQGDSVALQKLYTIDFKTLPASPGAWLLVLKPKIAPMDKLIDRLEVSGQQLVLNRLRIVEAGGDETVTDFHHVDPARRFTAAEKAKFFPPASK